MDNMAHQVDCVFLNDPSIIDDVPAELGQPVSLRLNPDRTQVAEALFSDRLVALVIPC